MSGHHSDDEDDDQTYFAGGERSGIAVQNPARGRRPGDIVDELLKQAEREGAEPAPDTSPSTRSFAFSGGGNTVGGEGSSSRSVPAAHASTPSQEEVVSRSLTFWRSGFTVEDGPLMRYDDPANAEVLASLRAGQAPPSILNVRIGQRVDVHVTSKKDEDFRPGPFSGTGNRLGSATPAATAVSRAPPASPRGNASPRFEVDSSLPTTSIQLRLADGTRMVCRMNLTHTVQDLCNFINASRPENRTRHYTIGTTFPNRTLDDMDATIEAAGLANSVVVQRWA
ncbi:unnamed protein product [Mycena citricolor]|uniref:SEP-domain-containing protein n=1 Tax=Mycena citricolor TaxID=2018698 RepID=A0AAD2K6M1_9AGAR|nr:unnamed protein product [Mycena citricolor]